MRKIAIITAAIFSLLSVVNASEYVGLDVYQLSAVTDEFSPYLKDAETAKYILPKYVDNDLQVYCGFVNSKNSFNAYTGYRPFVGMMSFNPFRFEYKFRIAEFGNTERKAEAIYIICMQSGYDLIKIKGRN